MDTTTQEPTGTFAKDIPGTPENSFEKQPSTDTNAPSNVQDTGKDTEESTKDVATDTTTKDANQDPAPDAADSNELQEEDIFVDHGHPAVNSAVEVLKEAGCTAAEIAAWFNPAAVDGDLSKVNFAAMADKIGAGKANLVMSAVRDWYNGEIAAQQEIRNTVDAVCGGAQNFEIVREWARSKRAGDAEFDKRMSDFEALFDMGPHTAKLAAQDLFQMYNDDPRNKSLASRMEHGDSRPTNETGFISRQDYIKQLKEAHQRGDNGEVERLNARRLNSMNQ